MTITKGTLSFLHVRDRESGFPHLMTYAIDLKLLRH